MPGSMTRAQVDAFGRFPAPPALYAPQCNLENSLTGFQAGSTSAIATFRESGAYRVLRRTSILPMVSR